MSWLDLIQKGNWEFVTHVTRMGLRRQAFFLETYQKRNPLPVMAHRRLTTGSLGKQTGTLLSHRTTRSRPLCFWDLSRPQEMPKVRTYSIIRDVQTFIASDVQATCYHWILRKLMASLRGPTWLGFSMLLTSPAVLLRRLRHSWNPLQPESASTAILANPSSLKSGICQGDPLSPTLFAILFGTVSMLTRQTHNRCDYTIFVRFSTISVVQGFCVCRWCVYSPFFSWRSLTGR